MRLPEPLYTRTALDVRSSGERVFDYVDPRQRDYQREMEQIATAHLRRLGAYLEPRFATVPPSHSVFSRARECRHPRAQSRRPPLRMQYAARWRNASTFPFNVIVVDNHSTDGTTAALAALAAADTRLVHLIPARTDLGIGGCWNEAHLCAALRALRRATRFR